MNKKAVIFGIGHNYMVTKKNLETMYDVVALVDNRYSELDGVQPVESIVKMDFDCIVVTPSNTKAMVEQLYSLGVTSDKIELLIDMCHVQNARNTMGLSCFGQHYDDLIVAAIFGMLGIERPSYLDLGANHPYECSNTALMYLNGCRGVNIDANRESIELFSKKRPEDININIGVANKEGKLEFYKFGDMSGLNTFSSKEVEKQNIKVSKTEIVQVTTLQNIIETYCGGVFPDFLDCDIEGYDYVVLAGYDLKTNGPKVICVEVRKSDVNKFDVMLAGKSYYRFCRIGENSIYVRDEFKGIVSRSE